MEAIVFLCPQCGGSSPQHSEHCLWCSVHFVTNSVGIRPLVIRIGTAVDFKRGIPSDLFSALRKGLCEAEDVFESNATLRAFFSVEPLSIVKNWLMESNNIVTRVMFLIDTLHRHGYYKPGAWYDGQNILIVFLLQLYGHYLQKGAMPPGMKELYDLLKQKGIFIEEVENESTTEVIT